MTFAIAVDDRFRLPRFGNALLQAIVGKVIMVFGEGLILGPTPSPAVRLLRALSGSSHGDLPQPLRPGCTKRPKGGVKSKHLKDS